MVENINRATLDAVDILKTCEMDYLVMGMSAATFWNGRAGAQSYLDMMTERAGVVSRETPLGPPGGARGPP
jgi:maleate isomerase